MVNPNEQEFVNGRNIDGTDRADQYDTNGTDESSSAGASSSGPETSSRQNRGSGKGIGLAERLTDILMDGDGDLLLQISDGEDGVMQWLQALDMQVMGACRSDERLKPLLKFNVSTGMAEDCLMAHLSQHFEPSEVGMLARCLCVPLVSVRVGKINKLGTRLCPTSTRGSLTLMLLPTSDLRISFIGDDGHVERLSTLSSSYLCASVAIEEILADRSGRSFLIKIPGGEIFYFWCSEKSKLLGDELLDKMKDILKRKPSIAELTGISESGLDCFATYLRAYLVGSTATNARSCPVVSQIPSDTSAGSPELCQYVQFGSLITKPSHPRPFFQGSLSPRSSSFKEGLPKNLASLRTVVKEKFRRRGESRIDNLSVASPSIMDASASGENEKAMLPDCVRTCLFPSSSFLESLGKSADPPTLSPGVSEYPSSGSSLFSPYYCWCPPVESGLQYTVVPLQLRTSPSTESFSLPPLASLLSTTRSSTLLTSMPPLSLPELPSMDFPPLLPEPFVRLPLSMPIARQIPTFTPLMCDPIVHIPIIDICSSGPGYLMSAGPAISTTIPPLHPTLASPLIPKSDSVLEKGARETLRLLLSTSNQSSPQLMVTLPSVLTNNDGKHGLLVTGSRGLYSGVSDVDAVAVANSIAAMGLVSSFSDSSAGSGSIVRRCISQTDLVDQLENPGGGSGGTCPDDEVSRFSQLGEGRTD